MAVASRALRHARLNVPARVVVVQMRSAGGGGGRRYADAVTDHAAVRDVLHAIDAPGNILSVLRDLTSAWGVLQDAQVAELVREVAHRQQRASAASEDHKRRRLMYTARELFERAVASRHRVLDESYTQLIVCLANSGAATLAEKYFADMKRLDLRPTLLTYTALVKALYSVSHFLRIQEIVDDMQQRGLSVEGAVEVNLLRAWAKRGEMWRAVQAVSRKGVRSMSSESVRAMLNGKDLRQTMKTFIWMKDRGLVMDQDVYLALLNECIAFRSPIEAEGVLLMMREDVIAVDDGVLRKLLDVYIAAHDAAGIAITLQRMQRAAVTDTVLAAAVLGLLHPSPTASQARTAAEVASDIVQNYRPQSRDVLAPLVRVFCRGRDVAAAETTLLAIRRTGVVPPLELVEEVKNATPPSYLTELHTLPFIAPLLPGV